MCSSDLPPFPAPAPLPSPAPSPFPGSLPPGAAVFAPDGPVAPAPSAGTPLPPAAAAPAPPTTEGASATSATPPALPPDTARQIVADPQATPDILASILLTAPRLAALSAIRQELLALGASPQAVEWVDHRLAQAAGDLTTASPNALAGEAAPKPSPLF